MTVYVFLRKSRCFLTFIRMLASTYTRTIWLLLDYQARWWVFIVSELSLPNFYIYRNKKLGRSKSSWLFPGAFLRQLQEGELESESDRQSMLTGQLGYTLISISHSIFVQRHMFIHYIFSQLSHPFRLYLLPYEFWGTVLK